MLIDCMMADIAEVLSYLPTAIIVGAVYALVAGIVLRLIGKRAASSGNTPGKVPFGENSVFKLTMSILLVIYIVVVLMTVFFSRELGSREFNYDSLGTIWCREANGKKKEVGYIRACVHSKKVV